MGSFPTVYQLKTETIKPRQFIHSVLCCWQNTQQETFQTKAQGKHQHQHQQDLCQGCENTTPQAWAGTQWLWQHYGWLQEHFGIMFQRGFFKAKLHINCTLCLFKTNEQITIKLAKSKRDLIPFFPESWQPYQDSVAGCWHYTTGWGILLLSMRYFWSLICIYRICAIRRCGYYLFHHAIFVRRLFESFY